MFTFLRKIRKSLINSGNVRKPASPVGKYLIYAIGEIALVVIGILIALQINISNEHRKERATEIKLLNALQEEISANIAQMKEGIRIHKSSQEMCAILLQHFADIDRKIDHNLLDSLVENVSVPYAINLKKGIVKSIIATGDLKLIENKSIVEFITVFEDQTEETKEDFTRLNGIYEVQLWPREHLYVRRLNRAPQLKETIGFNITRSVYNSDFEGFFNDISMENMYMLVLYEITDLIEGEELLLKHMENSLKVVKNELTEKSK
jgi:hypothetical protein